MKKYGWTAGLICLAAGVLAQVGVPLTFNYQGVLKRGDGSVVSPASMPITFKLYDQATAGDALWGREVAVLLDTNGLFNVELSDSAGGGVGVTGSLPDVIATHQDLYLELTVAASPILPRQKLLAVPFAMRAGDVQQAANDFTVQGTLTVQNGASVHSLTVQNDATVNGSLTVQDNVTVQSDATVSGSLTVQDNASVAGRIMNDFGGGHYDVWIQGSTDLSANNDSRNLALLGDALNDTLIINDGSSYKNGTAIYGPLDLVGGWKDESMDVNGYVQIGSVMIQWGVGTSTTDDAQTFDFPTAFPVKCFSVVVCRKDTDPQSPLCPYFWNTGGFGIDRDSGITGSVAFSYIAIGN